MPLIILSRRSISYRESGRGEINVLLVPGRDQIQVVKDLAGLGSAPTPTREKGQAAATAVSRKQIQLSRVHVGRRFIYGTLPNEISDLRQPVKVWLAEDYAPPQSQAFFYIFSNSVVIHGVREQDDEGFQNWRTAQLALDETDPLRSIINAISDYALANPVDSLTVAVHNKLDLYEKLQAGLATYNISPVPFSKLKPLPNAKPLYRHRDYTILYLTLALFGFIMLLSSAAYLVLTYMNLKRLDAEAIDIKQRIDNIKLNQNVGQVAEPQVVLQTMGRALNQQPSAILDAAGSTAATFGPLASIRANLSGGSMDGVTAATGEGQLNVQAAISKMANELLLTQEQSAASILGARPWVREIRRSGSVGERGELILTLQIDNAPSATVVPATAPTMQPPTLAPTVSLSAPVGAAAPAAPQGTFTMAEPGRPVTAGAATSPAAVQGGK